MNEYFLTCPRGLEEVTSNDIDTHIKGKSKPKKGGVSFSGNQEDLYKINLYSRTGMYLLKKLFEFKAKNINSIYNEVLKYKWSNILDSTKTFAIRTKMKSDFFDNSGYLTLKIKDAIVDRVRKDTGKRPSIDKIKSNFKIFVIIKDDNIKIYLDSSGRPLFMRGYRAKIHKASLNECLAAGLVLLSNWDKKKSFYDPMCGSGTIPIEAAMIAYNIPPGILRQIYGFQLWPDYDSKLWYKVLKESREKIKKDSEIKISGSDMFKRNIDLSIASAKKINLGDFISFSMKDIINTENEFKDGVVIMNPPYGIRLGSEKELEILYKTIGDTLKNKFIDCDAYIFTHNKNLAKCVGLRTKRKIILKNGQLDCRLLYYPIRGGTYS